MPVETRPTDSFTRDNLLLGFSVVEFEPSLIAGGFGAAVPLGILSGQTLQKEVETLELPRGDAGLITIDRELVSRLSVSMQLQTFNMRSDIFQYIMAATSLTPITADASAAGNTDLLVPSIDPFDAFSNLDHANLSEASIAVTFQAITSEAVGTGDGATGGTQGDFNLEQKIKAIGDVTVFLVGGVDETAKLVVGSTPTANEIAIEIGEEDSTTTGAGAITFGSGEIPANGAAIVATYTPSFSGADFENAGLAASLDNDYVLDPVLGKLRWLREAADDTPFRLLGANAGMNVAYTYNRRASQSLQPFTKNQFDGRATIRHLPDIGINFIWTIPSATIRITDDDLTFGAEDFGVGTLQLNINDAGGSNRFGTLLLSSETESAA